MLPLLLFLAIAPMMLLLTQGVGAVFEGGEADELPLMESRRDAEFMV